MFRLWVSAETLIGLLKERTMNKCPYCGLEARTDYPVEFRCGSVTNRHRSKTCLVLEIGLLKERVERLEEAGNNLRDCLFEGEGMEYSEWIAKSSDAARYWKQAKEAKR